MTTNHYTIDLCDEDDNHVPPPPRGNLSPLDAYEWMFGLDDVAHRYAVTEWRQSDDGDKFVDMINGDEFLAKGEPARPRRRTA